MKEKKMRTARNLPKKVQGKILNGIFIGQYWLKVCVLICWNKME